MGQSSQPGGDARRRSRRAGTVRNCRIAIAVDDAERAELEDAARAEGLTVSAFVAGAALHVARRTAPVATDALRDVLTELARATVQVQRVGTNLNQAVAAFHATGQPPGNLLQYARYASQVIERLDQVAARVARRLP
jgi:hypothetical protein